MSTTFCTAVAVVVFTVLYSHLSFCSEDASDLVRSTTSGLPLCQEPQYQLLKNLYFDYFRSRDSCKGPNGKKLQPFEYSDDGRPMAKDDVLSRHTRMCDIVPRVCQLMSLRSGTQGRFLFDFGNRISHGFRRTMKGVFDFFDEMFGPSTPRPFYPPYLMSYHQYAPVERPPSPLPPSSSYLPSPYLNFGLRDEATRDSIRLGNRFYSSEKNDNCAFGACQGRNVAACETEDNVVFPMVGSSAVSNETIRILQEHPALVQPVFFSRCRRRQPFLIHGQCVQKYIPMSFFVSPSKSESPGAVLARDFVMVEAGCLVEIQMETLDGRNDNSKLEQLFHNTTLSNTTTPT